MRRNMTVEGVTLRRTVGGWAARLPGHPTVIFRRKLNGNGNPVGRFPWHAREQGFLPMCWAGTLKECVRIYCEGRESTNKAVRGLCSSLGVDYDGMVGP